MKLSIVIPVYSSSKILEEACKTYKGILEKLNLPHEILFRYDCSPDDSYEVMQKLAKKYKNVRIFKNEKNMGLGFTLRNLFKDAKGEYVIYADADAYICFKNIDKILSKFIEEINNYDVIIASRYENKNKRIPFLRIISSETYNIINRILFGIKIRDIGSGFVIFKKEALNNITLKSNGFDIHIEIFTKLTRKNYNIKEIPVSYKHWYKGSFNILKHGPKTLLNTFRTWRSLK